VVQLTCCFVKVLTLNTRMVNCHFREFDVTEVRAVNIIIIISIIRLKLFYILCAFFVCLPTYYI
jgi:hypothetical protein